MVGLSWIAQLFPSGSSKKMNEFHSPPLPSTIPLPSWCWIGLIGTPRPKDRPEPAHHLIHQTITGNRGLPEDVAATVRFLCGPGARYINGQALHANGGAYLGA